jgi:glutamate synthase domain-containing protein 1
MHEQESPSGLYDPAFEHDACGAGFICNIDNEPTHDIVRKGLEMLINLEHRGACGCDVRTGDGAGILIQVPHTLLVDRCSRSGITLPEEGDYGVGAVFLPMETALRQRCMDLIDAVVREEGQQPLGWRRVPTDNASLGPGARAQEPEVWQVFIRKAPALQDTVAFERKLYVIRKVIEHRISEAALPKGQFCYISSLSSRTLVYKGMLTVNQLPEYYP